MQFKVLGKNYSLDLPKFATLSGNFKKNIQSGLRDLLVLYINLLYKNEQQTINYHFCFNNS